MTTLPRDGLDLTYEVAGTGPALLLPECNFRWSNYSNLDFGLLTSRFTVVTASPRGFATSARLAADGTYRVADFADDLVAVMDAVGFSRFSVFGYSFTGAFAPWLAHLTGRVDAVVAAGFPIAGDYSPLYPEILQLSAAAEADPDFSAALNARFDNRAALAFYRELSALPDDFLIDKLRCPLFGFWGDDDEEIERGGGTGLLASALDVRGFSHVSFPGYDHEGLMANVNEAVPSVLAWFDSLSLAD